MGIAGLQMHMSMHSSSRMVHQKKPPSTKETQPKKLLKTITKNDLDYHGINVQHMSRF